MLQLVSVTVASAFRTPPPWQPAGGRSAREAPTGRGHTAQAAGVVRGVRRHVPPARRAQRRPCAAARETSGGSSGGGWLSCQVGEGALTPAELHVAIGERHGTGCRSGDEAPPPWQPAGGRSAREAPTGRGHTAQAASEGGARRAGGNSARRAQRRPYAAARDTSGGVSRVGVAERPSRGGGTSQYPPSCCRCCNW